MSRHTIGLIAAIALFCIAPRANAEISLSQIIVDLAPTDPLTRDVEVSNIGTDTAYVEVTVFQITNPGQYPMTREGAKNPAELGLVATPTKLVLGPDSRRLIRLILLNPADEKERVWRVTVVPKVGELSDERTGVKVIVGYEILVFQRPKVMNFNLKLERQGKVLVASNLGNTNVLIPTITQCSAPTACLKATGTRIYPGRSEKIALPADAAVDILLQAAGRNWTEHRP